MPKKKPAEPAGLHVVVPWTHWIISLQMDEAEAIELAEGRVPQRIQDDCRWMLTWVYEDPRKVFEEAK